MGNQISTEDRKRLLMQLEEAWNNIDTLTVAYSEGSVYIMNSWPHTYGMYVRTYPVRACTYVYMLYLARPLQRAYIVVGGDIEK